MKTGTFSALEAPFRVPAFRAIWGANTVSSIGTLMQTVGAAWLMTSLTKSTILVGLVQTASTLPVFLLGLLAGALADTVERKHLLLWSQVWNMLMALTLGLLTLFHFTTPWVLLSLTFCIGMGTSISLPTWQASVQDIVPREAVAAAVSLNSISFNVARAIGPALGGLLVAVTGPATAFLCNAASFLGVIGAVSTWKPVRKIRSPLHESIIEAVAAGFRYLLHAKRLQAPIVRSMAFNLCGSAVWPLLPLFARHVLGTTATGYGLLLAAFGLGSIVSALLVPRLRNLIALERILMAGTLLCACAYFGLSIVSSFWPAALMMVFAGAAWVGVLINFNVAVQTAVPGWVRGRALSFYLLAFQGLLALGGFLWGTMAGALGVPECFAVAAIGLVLGLVMVPFFPVTLNEDMDLRPIVYEPQEHHQAILLDPGDGPVLVIIEYQIDAKDVDDFRLAMRGVRELRLRDGARRWRLYHDMQRPDRIFELFALDSWSEHLRQHERKTMSDRAIEARVLAFHRGPDRPKVTHHLRLED